MNDIVKHPMTFAWAVLVSATLVVYTLAESAASSRALVAGIVLIAGFKMRMVFLWFMELRSGAMPWRLVAEAWVALVVTIVVGGMLLTSA